MNKKVGKSFLQAKCAHVVYFSSQTNYVLYIVGTVELHDLSFLDLKLKVDDNLVRKYSNSSRNPMFRSQL